MTPRKVVAETSRCNVGDMASKAVTQADRGLLSALVDRGHRATPSQLKRWRAAGLLAPPLQRSAGRGKGRLSESYPPEAVEQAASIIELLGHSVPLEHMAVAMVVRGAP